jgi:predicted RNA binding protein YcfA (HicA-like mRNA interferase family)
MTRYPSLTGKEVITALKRLGFEVVRTKGSHRYVRHADGRGTAVPVHSGETIGRGLMAKILRDLDLTREELHKAL